MKRMRFLIVGLIIAALLFMTAPIPAAQATINPGVIPPNARVQGMTYGEWQTMMWKALFAIPADQNPGLGAPWTTCFIKRIGNVGIGVTFFLPTGTFECQMPSGMILFLPVIGSECSTLEPPPFHGDNEEQLRACAESFVPQDTFVSVDGVPLQNLEDYIFTSPVFEFTVPENNFLGVPAGTGQSVAHGLALMLTPLTPGKHTLVLQGAFPEFGFFYNWTYSITVTQGP